MIDRTTGIVDAANNPTKAEQYKCQGFCTNALVKHRKTLDKHAMKTIVVSENSEIIVCYILISNNRHELTIRKTVITEDRSNNFNEEEQTNRSDYKISSLIEREI